MRASRWYACLAVLNLLGIGCYPQSRSVAVTAPRRTVEVVEIRTVPIQDQIVLIGEIEPSREATLCFEVVGVVDEIVVEEGAVVAPGDPIATLVAEDYELAVRQAEAQCDAARAEWDLLLAGTRIEDLEAARADHDRSRVLTAYWDNEFQRCTRLFQAGSVVSDEELQRVRNEYQVAVQQERASQARWQRAVTGPRKEELAAAEARFHASEQFTATARRQLEKATLRAPFRGRVEKRFVDQGAYVNVFPTGGVPIVQLVDWRQADAVLAVPEALRPQLSERTSVTLASAVHPDLQFEGHVVALGKLADRTAGTYPMRIRVPNPDDRLTGGMVVTATWRQSPSRHAIRIPVTAVRQAHGQSPSVLLVEDRPTGTSVAQQVVSRDVRLGELAEDQVEIVAGLKPGERLIVRGQDRVVEGDHVLSRSAP